MFPVVLDLSRLRVAIAGRGDKAVLRLAQVAAAGGSDHVTVFSDDPDDALQRAAGERLVARWPSGGELESFHVLLVTGVERQEAATLAEQARQRGVLVNVEDDLALCDFHLPAVVRRGDLVLAVSTGGRSPALARRIKHRLEHLFGDEWRTRLDAVASRREVWRREGRDPATIGRLTNDFIDEQGWLS